MSLKDRRGGNPNKQSLSNGQVSKVLENYKFTYVKNSININFKKHEINSTRLYCKPAAKKHIYIYIYIYKPAAKKHIYRERETEKKDTLVMRSESRLLTDTIQTEKYFCDNL